MPRYIFVGEPPRSFKILFIVAFINFFVTAMAWMFHRYWAVRSADATFTYPIRFKGEGVWYFRPALGAYITWSFVGHFVALAVLALILFRNRHLLRRVR